MTTACPVVTAARAKIRELLRIRPHTHALRMAVHYQVRIIRAVLFGGGRRRTDRVK